MNILMVTNSFTPLVGGVARSVADFTDEFRRRGHNVLVVAPEFDEQPENETGVVRLAAIQHFNGSDFSVALPFSRYLRSEIDDFRPQIVHSHHPFLLGATAVRIAHHYDCPLVFTHHTMYEHYTHYVPGDSPTMKRFVIDLATHYANICDHIVAPSNSIATILRHRGVETPLSVAPTGIRVSAFATGTGTKRRAAHSIPDDAIVFGHVGRLAPEKNLPFLARAVARTLADFPDAHFLVVGSGPSGSGIEQIFADQELSARLHLTGTLHGQDLIDAYHAMDAFVFASASETQGLVIAEAMAAGLPVIALDAPGVREIVSDGINGRLLEPETPQAGFAKALRWFLDLPANDRQALAARATKSAQTVSIEASAEIVLAIYKHLLAQDSKDSVDEAYRLWALTQRRVATEWALLRNLSEAVQSALQSRSADPELDAEG